MDLSHMLDYSGVFEPLRDPAYFAHLHADAGAAQSSGSTTPDVAPETLYACATGERTSTSLSFAAI